MAYALLDMRERMLAHESRKAVRVEGEAQGGYRVADDREAEREAGAGAEEAAADEVDRSDEERA